MRELDKVLDSSEKVLWEGAPQFIPFAIGSLGALFFGILWVVLLFVFSSAVHLPSTLSGLMTILVVLYLIPAILCFLLPINSYLNYRVTYYALTDKRVIIQTGIIGRDFHILDFDKITEAHVEVGLKDKLFGKNSGSIVISSGSLAATTSHHRTSLRPVLYMFAHINEPYQVFSFFKKTEFDVKADIQYPNAMRPDENPGYRTKYKRK